MEMRIMTTRKTTKHPPMIIMERSVSATMAATGPFIWGGQSCNPVLAVCRYLPWCCTCCRAQRYSWPDRRTRPPCPQWSRTEWRSWRLPLYESMKVVIQLFSQIKVEIELGSWIYDKWEVTYRIWDVLPGTSNTSRWEGRPSLGRRGRGPAPSPPSWWSTRACTPRSGWLKIDRVTTPPGPLWCLTYFPPWCYPTHWKLCRCKSLHQFFSLPTWTPVCLHSWFWFRFQTARSI